MYVLSWADSEPVQEEAEDSKASSKSKKKQKKKKEAQKQDTEDDIDAILLELDGPSAAKTTTDAQGFSFFKNHVLFLLSLFFFRNSVVV